MIQLLSSLPLPSTFLFQPVDSSSSFLIYEHNPPIHAAILLPMKARYSVCRARIQTLVARAAGGSSPEPQTSTMAPTHYRGNPTPVLIDSFVH